MKVMTDDEYVANAGALCPVCRGSDISIRYGSDDSCDLESWHEVICEDCGASWQEVFKMTGIDCVRDGDGKELKR